MKNESAAATVEVEAGGLNQANEEPNRLQITTSPKPKLQSRKSPIGGHFEFRGLFWHEAVVGEGSGRRV